MRILHSRNGYDKKGFRDFLLKDYVFDVYEDGKKKGHITSKWLKQYITRCLRQGVDVRERYANLLDSYKIVNPKKMDEILKPKKPVVVEEDDGRFKPIGVSIDEQEVAHWQGCEICKNCTVGVMNGKKNFGFEFDNGFVIGVFGYKAVVNSDYYSEADFTIFGQSEHFGFGPDFHLVIFVFDYSQDSMSGRISVSRAFPDTQDYQNGRSQVDVIGDFELTKSGTTYKGVHTNTVQNSAHFAKEFILK